MRVSIEQIGDIRTIIQLHQKVISTDNGSTPLSEMDIVLTYDIPRYKPYRMSPRHMKTLREEIRMLLNLR